MMIIKPLIQNNNNLSKDELECDDSSCVDRSEKMIYFGGRPLLYRTSEYSVCQDGKTTLNLSMILELRMRIAFCVDFLYVMQCNWLETNINIKNCIQIFANTNICQIFEYLFEP